AGELPALGCVSARIAPPNGVAATGWQTGNLLPQLGPAVLLGRGASLTVPRATVPSRGGQRTTDAMVRIFEAMAAQSGAETRLAAQRRGRPRRPGSRVGSAHGRWRSRTVGPGWAAHPGG